MRLGILAFILIPFMLLVCSCECKPDCSGKQCGDDGCGGSCGDCLDCHGEIDPSLCRPSGHCIYDDCPQCTGKCCGDDTYGGTCPDNCPEGYVCNLRSCQCEAVDCLAGTMPGLCGLEGTCVQCITSDDCGSGEYCSEAGECAAFTPCGPEHRCSSLFQTCGEDGLCYDSCSTEIDCPKGSLCKEHMYCYRERCTPAGTCPEDWEPINGSLECALAVCPDGLIPGKCGLEGFCVGCNTDADCSPSVRCAEVEATCLTDWDSGCTTDSECGTNEVCINMRCERACVSEMDCRYGEECLNGICRFICEHDMDCVYGMTCVSGECKTSFCQDDGTCPDGFKPVEGELRCVYDPCSDLGLIVGGCGLYPQCVECFVDMHCSDDEICDMGGKCVSPECDVDDDCDVGLHCINQRCVLPCLSDEDCGPNQACPEPPSYCYTVRCGADGKCLKEKWLPIPGTLACQYDLCPKGAVFPGVCSLADSCVECIVDGDCEATQFCSLVGRCIEYPECEVGDCPTGKICVNGKCEYQCTEDVNCLGGAGECQPGNYCHFERCAADGTCPDGWRPGDGNWVPGTLACVKL